VSQRLAEITVVWEMGEEKPKSSTRHLHSSSRHKEDGSRRHRGSGDGGSSSRLHSQHHHKHASGGAAGGSGDREARHGALGREQGSTGPCKSSSSHKRRRDDEKQHRTAAHPFPEPDPGLDSAKRVAVGVVDQGQVRAQPLPTMCEPHDHVPAPASHQPGMTAAATCSAEEMRRQIRAVFERHQELDASIQLGSDSAAVLPSYDALLSAASFSCGASSCDAVRRIVARLLPRFVAYFPQRVHEAATALVNLLLHSSDLSNGRGSVGGDGVQANSGPQATISGAPVVHALACATLTDALDGLGGVVDAAYSLVDKAVPTMLYVVDFQLKWVLFTFCLLWKPSNGFTQHRFDLGGCCSHYNLDLCTCVQCV
jgi:hypothetical protein